MDTLLWIVIGVFIACVIVALVFIIKLNSGSRRGSEMHISGGANIEKGYLSNDNNYFKGGYENLGETVVISADYRTSTGEMKYVMFTNLVNYKTFSLNVKDTVILGRVRAEGVFVLDSDPSISKKHCKLTLAQGRLYAEDMGSSNHTYVNSKILTAPCQINNGDILKLGNTSLRVNY